MVNSCGLSPKAAFEASHKVKLIHQRHTKCWVCETTGRAPVLCCSVGKTFSQLVGEVKQMGFDIQKVIFVEAMKALAGKETTWKRCEEAYKRWSWSDQEILDAFRMYPLCMIKSENKIMETMDFLVNKMGWQSQTIAKLSHVFSYSLDKRIIPRSSVVKVLMLKGLVKQENLSLATTVMTPENYFLHKFVTANLSQVPQLLNVYQGKVDISSL